MPCKFHQQVLMHGNQSQIRKAFLCHNRFLLIKEKDRSASALDISNVLPTTSRTWMFGKESLSHAPKASRRIFFVWNSSLFIHSPFHLLTSLPRDLGYWRSFSHLSISLMYSSGFTKESIEMAIFSIKQCQRVLPQLTVPWDSCDVNH